MIVFISCYINHHQYPIAKELYRITNGGYRFVELMPMPEFRRQLGYGEIQDDGIIVRYWNDAVSKNTALDIIENSEVVLLGDLNYLNLIDKRVLANKLTFLVSERWFKKGIKNIISPRLLKLELLYHTKYYNKPLYQLCASAYCSKDLWFYRSFKNKCFKWGYFIDVPDIDIEAIIKARESSKKFRLIWIGRLIDWKHPDLAIEAANQMLNHGYDFELCIYGSGPMRDSLDKLISKYGLQKSVFLKGSLPNEKLMTEFAYSDVMLFTSDRREGWGAVVGEAMAHGCFVIGNDAAGSVPYLIKDNVNGLIYSNNDSQELFEKIRLIYDSIDFRNNLTREAYLTMKNLWNPHNAAENLISLIDSLTNGKSTPIKDGPCSLAPVI